MCVILSPSSSKYMFLSCAVCILSALSQRRWELEYGWGISLSSITSLNPRLTLISYPLQQRSLSDHTMNTIVFQTPSPHSVSKTISSINLKQTGLSLCDGSRASIQSDLQIIDTMTCVLKWGHSCLPGYNSFPTVFMICDLNRLKLSSCRRFDALL